MDLLGSQVLSPSSWVDTMVKNLGEDEGTKGTDSSVEANKKTRAYGITFIPEALKPYAAREKDDKKVATAIVNYNADQMRKDKELDFDNLPDSMKMIASDVMYNTGTLFDNFRGALVNRDYPEALKQSLDIVSATDPKADMERKVVRGLVNRRIKGYNRAAENLGIPEITGKSILPSEKEGYLTNITYKFGGKQDPFIFDINKGMHSSSITDDRPLGYDVIEKAIGTPKPIQRPKIKEPIFGTESLAFPGYDIDILGGLPKIEKKVDFLGR